MKVTSNSSVSANHTSTTTSLRKYLATSDAFLARLCRRTYRGLRHFSIPSPRFIFRPLLHIFLLLRSIWHFFLRVFFAEPLFKAYCKQYGSNVHTDIRLHWVQGKGDFIIGNNVLIDGLCSFKFARRYSNRPVFRIGDNCGISNGCRFVIAKSITIGDFVRIGPAVSMRDSDGHAVEADARKRGDPPADEAVRPIVIGNNVWIGAGAVIGPGIVIGEGSIISTNSVLHSNVAPYTIVAGNSARKVGAVPCMSEPIEPTEFVESGIVA